MQEVFEKIKRRIMSAATEACGYDALTRVVSEAELKEIIEREVDEYNNGWIPAEKPPKNNNYILLSFENFPVSLVGRYEEDQRGGAYYAGDDLESCISEDMIVNAWQPLPKPYQLKER